MTSNTTLGPGIALFGLYAIVMYGCTTAADSKRSSDSVATGTATSAGTGAPAAETDARPDGTAARPGIEPVATLIDARPAALVDGHGVQWGDLRAGLSDAAGAEVLRELVIDRALARSAAEAGLAIVDRDLAAEESLLLATLGDDATTSIRLLEELRNRRNLGPARYQRLLWRNATMRALVRDQVQITNAAVEQMFDTAYGARRQARLLTTPDLAKAQYAIERTRAGDFLGDLAVEFSTDASAARGGLLEPVGRLDPSYPAALLQAIWSLPRVGAISDAVLLGRSYAIVQLVRELPADPDATLAGKRRELESLVRLNQERALMDRVARRILAEAQITIFDDELNEAWRRFQSQSGR